MVSNTNDYREESQRCQRKFQWIDLAIFSKRYGLWRYNTGTGNVSSEYLEFYIGEKLGYMILKEKYKPKTNKDFDAVALSD